MADEDYVSFENALRDLKISADQLKRLVSEGEIRAIRGEHNTMRFRKDEIDRLKQDSGKTLGFTEATSETLSDDLLFDDADDQDIEEGTSTVQMKPSAPAPKPVPAPPSPKATPKPAARPASPRATPARAASPASRPVTPVRRTTSRSAAKGGRDTSGIGVGMMVALSVATMVMIFGSFVLLDIAEDQASPLTRGLPDAAKPATR